MAEIARPGKAPRRLAARAAHPAIVGTLLFLTVLAGYLLSYNVDKPTHNADWYIRYQVACSIVERNAFFINPYDASERSGPGADGHAYAQYTLGQTSAMIPLYLLGRALAGVAHTNCDQRTANTIVFLTCKSLDIILGALLAILFYATARLLAYPRCVALALTLLLAFGAPLWPDVLSNEEHTMESLFLLAAAYAALRYTLSAVDSRQSTAKRGAKERRLWLVAMGLAAGLVFVTRVAGLIAIPIFAVYLLALHASRVDGRWSMVDSEAATEGERRRRGRTLAQRTYYRLSTIDYRLFGRDLALYSAGVAPSLLINMAYNLVRWGRPLQTGPKPDHTLGYPPWLGLPNLLVSPGKGLLWYAPALLLLALAARPFRRRLPLPALLCALICGVYLLFYSNVNYWHGDPAWGPRYLYATLPYLVLPLGEVFARWRGYRRPVRGLLVGALALSFLVQFSAVSVSYWRHWYYIYGYHYDQVENHGWGSNLHYWWSPEQSPILISLEGIADITQKYVDGAPLLEHQAGQRLSDPRESSIYQAHGQAAVYLTDLDKLRDMANWNTFTPWWAHVYPWWDLRTVVRLALALVAVFLLSGGLLLTILALAERPLRAPPPAPRDGRGTPPGQRGTNGNGRGHIPLGGLQLAGLDIAGDPAPAPAPAPIGSAARGPATLTVAAPLSLQLAPPVSRQAARPATGLLPLGLAALVAALVYGGIADIAALGAPRATASLVHVVGMNATVSDGAWTYRVLAATSVPGLPGGLEAPIDETHHYVVLRLRLYNGLSRPRGVYPDWFDLTDSAGLRYQYMDAVSAGMAELSHQAPVRAAVPAHSSVDTTLVYQVRNATPDRDLALLGPGITLVRLGAS